jgi:putative membrane protein
MAPGSPTDGPRDAADPENHEPDVQLSFANERTFLAWQRTALGLITAGLAITQLLPSFDFPGARRLIGLPLIGLGVVIAAVS